MSPGAEDGSPSSGPGVDRETSSIMADEKIERASTDEKSPARSGVESKPAPKSNPKDPSRPRRKKARRACFACQRAHLTCGDERPCLRCIKRGLQDQCHDGVRKKAKYLHDAPPEALMPGFPPNQFSTNGSQNAPPVTANNQITQNGISISQPPNFMPQTSSSNFPQFSPVNHGGRMAAPMIEGNDPMLGGNFGGPQQNVETPSQYQSTPTQQTSPVQTIPGSIDQPPTIETSRGQSYDQSFMDPNDPSLFNFDISGLNFGNHYGALEFGMLGHMSSGAVGTPDVDLSSIGNQSHHNSMSYDNTSGFNGNNFNMNQFSGWPGLQRQSSNNNIWTASSNGMDAFAIGEASLTGQSPASQNLDFNSNYQSGGTMSPENQFAQVDQSQQQSQDLLRQSFSQPTPQQPRKQVPPFNGGGHPRKRRRDISEIYTSVTAPYPYTQGFHALTAFLQKRFPSKKTLRIAKALASIRPSFISCNKNLGHEDLIFMEKCFQRTLCEYEDFVNHYGTPTIICRRTGEIAAVSKEFSLVTGWRRDVLLGKEANLNINTGSNNSGTQTGTSSRGAVTPRAPVDIDPGRPQPVFLAEIMDEDSVVQFYEDFAELAFGASRASIIGPTVSLLKYKTKDDPGWGANDFGGSGDDGKRGRSSSGDVKMEPLMKGDAGTKALGDRDGRVDCSMCWTVKRDVFDIPMLIVMNFLPII